MRTARAVLAASLSCTACVGAGDDASSENHDSESEPAGSSELGAEEKEEAAKNSAPDAELRELASMEAMATSERIGEAQEASAAGDACVAACAASYALLCHRVRVICAAATVVTLGNATVECATALGFACVGGAALAAICARRCPP
jgi:hypothetical protein